MKLRISLLPAPVAEAPAPSVFELTSSSHLRLSASNESSDGRARAPGMPPSSSRCWPAGPRCGPTEEGPLQKGASGPLRLMGSAASRHTAMRTKLHSRRIFPLVRPYSKKTPDLKPKARNAKESKAPVSPVNPKPRKTSKLKP